MAKLIQGSRKRRERGATLILFTFLTVLVLIPVIGLAIDGAIVMWEKARLSSSVDAAAYAAGRALNLGGDPISAQAAAIATVRAYFNANFPPGNMQTTASVNPQVPIPQPGSGLWKITVDATANVPLYFLRVLGFNNASLSAHAQVSRRNVNIVVVLDRSYSLHLSNSCSPLIASAQNFTNMFVAGQDNLGLITFQTTANLDFPPGSDFKTRSPNMVSVIGQLACSGYTNTVQALWLAENQIQKINQPNALNVIVFFSDGKPDAITASFNNNGNKQADTRDNVPYPWNYPTQVGNGSCQASPQSGVLVALDENPDAAGYTLGLLAYPDLANYPSSGSPINSTDANGALFPQTTPASLQVGYVYPPSSQAQGCSFATTQITPAGNYQTTPANGYIFSGGPFNVRFDIDFVPDHDIYGNATNTSFRPPDLFPAGSTYMGQIRPDTPAGVVNAALNAAYEQAKKIHNDTVYNPVVYSIGLGSYVDTDFMREVANDPQAIYHDPARPSGFYVYAPSASQLSSAFQQIASQVLRISQ